MALFDRHRTLKGYPNLAQNPTKGGLENASIDLKIGMHVASWGSLKK